MPTNASPSRLDALRDLVGKVREGIDDEARFAVRHFAGPSAFVDEMAPIRVAHLTDQHVGRVTAMAVQHAAVDLALEGDPDVVVLTGDFVCHSLAYLDALVEVVARFGRPTYAVLGNHDYWSGAREVRHALARGGVEVLSNAWTTTHVRGQALQVVGLDDAYTGHHDRAAAVAGLRPGVPTLGLSHIGEEADGLWAHGVPLVLAGHTHAGQVTFAGLNELLVGRVGGHKYVHGLYGSRREPPPKGAVYVGAGVGAGVVPLRIGERTRREVAFFDLGRAIDVDAEHHEEQRALPGRRLPEWLVKRRAEVVRKKDARRARGLGGRPR